MPHALNHTKNPILALENQCEHIFFNSAIAMCTILYLTFKITVWLWKTPDINAIKKNKDVDVVKE
jgi:hypothetical protein